MKHGKVDVNQPSIVKELRQAGIDVFITSDVAGGFPDIVCGFRGLTYIFEIKDPDQPPSKRRFTKSEREFHESWRGQVDIILGADDALRIMEAI